MKIYQLNEDIKDLETEELHRLLETDYSDAYEHAQDGKFIYKGMYTSLPPNKAHLLEPLKNRPSQNTLNYYTLWMNNSKQWSEFPKRSVICTTSASNAGDYGFQTFIILPKNGSKIGVCSDFDLWTSFDFGGGMADASDVNHFFRALFEKYFKNTPYSYEDLVKMLKSIEVDDQSIEYVSTLMSRHGLNKALLIDIFKEEGAYGLFAKLFNTKGFKLTDVDGVYNFSDDKREVWFDNEFIAIDLNSRNDVL